MHLQLHVELIEVGKCRTLPQHASMKLLKCLLKTGSVCGLGVGIERHWFAIDDLVLPDPASVRLADLDLNARVLFSPSPNEMFHFTESLDLFGVRSLLANLDSAVRLDQDFGQVGEALQKEADGDEHRFAGLSKKLSGAACNVKPPDSSCDCGELH